MDYSPGLKLIRIPCTGRMDPTLILKSFERGADGVLVLGCRPGECHYRDGNTQALRRHALLLPLLAQLGIEPERIHLDWVAATDGRRFADIVSGMAARLKKLGPAARGPASAIAASGDGMQAGT